ncbi:MAG: tRNA uridine-5-carboxymethylaminomethyl(34) synthesis GTPase MnmE [Bacteroidales bacterium]|jgi:tRNA modification GTPase|nr:tRNA uridine-5-carboxymethylaminomethyl(34) synthesis GTPase MnmE [Bacteroidales bacterium]
MIDINDIEPSSTICALSTPMGKGAIAIIRLSGSNALRITDKIFVFSKKDFNIFSAKSHTIHLGNIVDENKEVIDQCLISIFLSPKTYTGEDMVEFSLHCSKYIIKRTLELLLNNGARLAQKGEFTKRAFLYGKMNLSQAEAVADLIQSDSRAAHSLAIKQLKGNYNDTLQSLRKQLLNIASLMELELDFSEEDVEFFNRDELLSLLDNIRNTIQSLISSYKQGNAFKEGVPVSIIGKPNVGKSTLLNVILNDKRAIVSDIEGTTRDTLEERINLKGVDIRFIDTAGIRNSTNIIEQEGIKRTFKAVEESLIVILLVDISRSFLSDVKKDIEELKNKVSFENKNLILVLNKIDAIDSIDEGWQELNPIFISAQKNENINELLERIIEIIRPNDINDKVFISSLRHSYALKDTLASINDIEQGFKNLLPTDIITIDVRKALYHLGEITGEITNEDILSNIFSQFCIGK